jgi:ABC-type nitrate/sulfonate/bicarbonate transport system substrate-binding protein
VLQKAGLTQADVTFSNKSTGPADQYTALANKAVDVQMTTEPNATALQEKGVAVKWLTAADVMPWFQDSYLAVNAPYYQPHRDILQKFLNGYVRAIADVQRSQGKLTPELTATLAKWADSPPDVVNAIGGVPYFGQNGAINADALRRLQALWISEKLVQTEVDVAKTYDDSLIKRAKP